MVTDTGALQLFQLLKNGSILGLIHIFKQIEFRNNSNSDILSQSVMWQGF